ncbi:MAG: response regulator transcription factor [Candidatus Solibacter usitatus]|nr:response regulator transcription factor [Candidatus Solibacter usitatus]
MGVYPLTEYPERIGFPRDLLQRILNTGPAPRVLYDDGIVNAPRLLLIDDDVELCQLMKEFFTGHGMEISMAHDGARGLALAFEEKHDIILLDVMMPVLDGFEVLSQFRKRSRTPVIMLTARTSQQDRIHGLDAGADDYLPKPFGPEELLARIRAVLRRSGGGTTTPDEYETCGVRMRPASREIWCDGQPVELTGAEFDILDVLVRSAGRVVTRDELASVLYQREASPLERSLDVHISRLRKKLESKRDLIRTIRGTGYQFALVDSASGE